MIAASVVVDCSNDYSQMRCRRTCVAGNCNRVEIMYGKYCGVGWSGCPGEKPCDDLDSCCQVHDECVEKKGMTNINAMENSRPVSRRSRNPVKLDSLGIVRMPNMVQGMDVAILLSQFGNSKLELCPANRSSL